MKRLVPCLVIGLSAVAWVGAQENPAPAPAPVPVKSPEAIEILKKVDAAAKAVDSVRYKATSTPTGVAVNFVGPAEGSVVMEGWNGQTPAKFRIEAMMKRPGADQPVQLTAGGNGDTFFLIDAGTKKVYEDMDPGVMGRTGQALRSLMMAEFVHDKPFDDELNADGMQLLGQETIGGEPCNKIEVAYSGGQGTSTWFFSTKDNLPRRRVRKFSTPQGEGTIDLTVTDLEVAPKVDAAVFAMKLPDGYVKVDDFAP